MKPLYAEHHLTYSLAGLVLLWFSFKGIRAGYRTLKMGRFPEELKQMDHIIAALGVPDDYYRGRRVARVGIANILFGVAFACMGFSLLLNLELLASISVIFFFILGFVGIVMLILDSPWKRQPPR